MSFFFFFNDTATTEIYTLSLHDALPISIQGHGRRTARDPGRRGRPGDQRAGLRVRADRRLRLALGAQRDRDRKSTRLNSSHLVISYAGFCLKKKTSSSGNVLDFNRYTSP